jgi:hypothetical protein
MMKAEGQFPYFIDNSWINWEYLPVINSNKPNAEGMGE